MPKSASYKRLLSSFETVHDRLTGHEQAEMSQWLNEKSARHVCKVLRQEQEVKTIWKTNEAIRIDSFYHPSKLQRLIPLEDSSNIKFYADDYSDFLVNKAVLIEGIVGHGKSILLRHLHNFELNNGRTLPIFIELRDVDDPTNLGKYIKEYINNNLRLRCSDKLFDALLRLDFLAFFFDGFDEIDEENKDRYVSALVGLYKRCNEPIYFVTSRPNVVLGKSVSFSVFRMCDIEDSDQESLIKKLLKDQREYKPLIENLNKNQNRIRDLLRTPLILTLFALVYKNKIVIPNTYASFYKQLFDTLISSHDGLKVGFARKTKSGLTAEELKSVIEYISLKIRKDGKKRIDHEFMVKLCVYGLKNAQLDTGLAKKCVDDIVSVTCLIQKESHNYEFLHQTILHYFSASCLANNASDEQAKVFYENRLNGDWKKWANEFQFLISIDRRRFHKYYFIPAVERLFGSHKFPDNINFTDRSSEYISKSFHMVLREAKVEKKKSDPSITIFAGEPICWVIPKLFPEVESIQKGLDYYIVQGFLSHLSENKADVNRIEALLRKSNVRTGLADHDVYISDLDHIVNELGIRKEFTKWLNKMDFYSIRNEYDKAQTLAEPHGFDEDIFS